MAYTFGAATADDISIFAGGGALTLAADGTAQFFAGWFFPTTLTATRGLFSVGNTFGAEIDTTTSELRLRTDNTTDGQWTTTGVGLALNTWTFIAVMNSIENTGVLSAWRVWSGTIDNSPLECTVTSAVAPVGNFTGNTTVYIGNKGTGTLAFQGNVADFCFQAQVNNINPSTSAFALTTSGVITNNEAEFIRDRFVIPAWKGELFAQAGHLRKLGTNNHEYIVHHPLLTPNSYAYSVITAGTPINQATVNGATISQGRGPRPSLNYHPHMPALARTMS